MSRRMAWIAGLVVALGGGSAALVGLLKGHHNTTPARSFDQRYTLDRRCRGGCGIGGSPGPGPVPAPIVSILPAWPTDAQIAAGTLTAKTGQTVSVTRASHRWCTRRDAGMVDLGNNTVCVESNGISLEPASTNLLTHSTEPFTGWTATNVTATKDGCTAPDGTATGTKLDIPATDGGVFVLSQAITIAVPSSASTLSGYMKLISGSPTQLCATVSRNDGAAEHTSACVTPSGEWQRPEVDAWSGGGSNNSWLMEFGVDGAASGVAVQPAFSVCLWGPQLEAQLVASSLISTVAASATRAAEFVRVSGLSLTPGLCLGATVVAAPASNVGGTDRTVLTLDDGAYTDALALEMIGSLPAVQFNVNASDDNAADPNLRESVAHAYATNQRFSACIDASMGLTLYRNGAAVAGATTGTPGPYTAAAGELNLASYGTGDTVNQKMTLVNICLGATHADCP